jgi:hypothetical protein
MHLDFDMQGLVQAMMRNNPGRVIPDDRVLGFNNREEANVWLLANPDKVLGGVHFDENLGPSRIFYTIQTNSSVRKPLLVV